LGHSNSKKAIRVSKGVNEAIMDFDGYKKENVHLKFDFVKDLYGIMGHIKKETREYLVMIDECSLMGQILKCNIYRVDQLLIVPLQKDSSVEDMLFVGYLEGLINEKCHYFSYNYNLSKTLQNNIKEVADEGETKESKGLQKKGTAGEFWDQYDETLVFNKILCKEWDASSNELLWDFIVPLIYGYVFVHALHFDQKKAEFILISKKDCKRLGRRFVSRGLDSDGNASNFVETEHIIVHYEDDGYKVASY